MAETSKTEQRAWYTGQVAAYKKLFPDYEEYAATLEKFLGAEVGRIAPLAIVQTRPKAVASFAEKILRKSGPGRDPAHELTDLCGGRVICRTPSEVEAVCRLVEDRFEVDVENSEMKGHVDTGWRGRAAAAGGSPMEFGYRSIHYIVAFKDDASYGMRIPARVRGLWAEVQVRTVAEHSWADFGHDLSYKGAFELPVRWQRELAIIAAGLEDVDRAYDRIEQALRTYASSYGSYLSEEEVREEVEILETVRRYDRRNAKLAARIGKLAMTIGDWEKAVQVMSSHVDASSLDSAHQPLLRDLGVALCKVHVANPNGRDYARGQRYLKKAVELSERKDPDALASLAGTWKRKNGWEGDQARELYREAFEADPSDFYPLTNFLEFEVRRARSTSVVAPMAPAMRAAIERCSAQAEVGVNLPWVFYGTGKLRLLLGEPYDAVRAYAKAVQASPAGYMIDGALESLAALAPVKRELEGYEWVRRLLLAGRSARFPTPAAKAQVRRLSIGDFASDRSVVIVVGGTHASVAARMKAYRGLLEHAFRDFAGTIICGGTKAGVSGLVGGLSRGSRGRIRAVGYLPRRDVPAAVDTRYEIRETDGAGFSPLEPLQNWIDLIASGVDPKDVRVLGINGGDIAAVEYRIALALGASVGVVEQSGREASKLLADEQWVVAENLAPLPHDEETVRAFVGSGTSKLSAADREAIARDIHERHRADAAAEMSTDPFMRPWDELSGELKESSRQQADHIEAKLRDIGCSVRPVTDRKIVLMSFTDEEVERLSEMEHGRWNAERLTRGWRWGDEKDTTRKISPSLVPWSELPENVRDYDRKTVRAIPRYLEAIGLEVRRGR
jgi:ppGpp synthetase/RelA/SpoT-type nucleotidyltranferase